MTRPLTRTAAAVLLTALAAAACAPAAEPGSTAAGATPGAASCAKGALPTLTAGTLTFGTDQPVYEPWFVDDDPTSGKGFESAVAYGIAGELGYARDKVTWVRVPFNSAIAPGPKTYDIDLNEFSITEDRRKAVDFTSPYYDVTQAVVALEADAASKATTIAGLKTAKLGAQVGTTSYDAITRQIAPATQPAVFNSNDDAKLALTNGQIDALVVDLPTAFELVGAELQGAKVVGQIPNPQQGTPEQFGGILDKGSALTTCVSAAVDRMKASGALDAIGKQWLASAGTAPELR